MVIENICTIFFCKFLTSTVGLLLAPMLTRKLEASVSFMASFDAIKLLLSKSLRWPHV